MISRTTFCSAQASTIRFARTEPIPSTSRRRSGSASITSNTFSPNARTSFFAYAGPMPRIIPEARYFTIPSSDVGAEVFRKRARNCCPCARSLTHSPDAVIHSPAEIDAAWPTTVEIAMSARLGSENAESVFLVVEGDPLDQTGQHFLPRRVRFRLHLGNDCLPRGLRERFPMRFSQPFRRRSQGSRPSGRPAARRAAPLPRLDLIEVRPARFAGRFGESGLDMSLDRPSAAIASMLPASAVHWRDVAVIMAKKPVRYQSIAPCIGSPGVSIQTAMTDILEKKLIEALESVEAHVHDPMTMLLRENAIQAHLMCWDDARGRFVLTGTGRRRMSAGSRAPGAVVSFRKRGVVNGGALQRKPPNANVKE